MKYIHFTFKAEILFVMLFVSDHPNGRFLLRLTLCVGDLGKETEELCKRLELNLTPIKYRKVL